MLSILVGDEWSKLCHVAACARSETVACVESLSPVSASRVPMLAATADAMASLARTPPMGWMSWEVFRCDVDCAKAPNDCIGERLYQTTADAMVAGGYVAAGYDTVHIDDCWEQRSPPRDERGRLAPNATRFPSGMAALARYMHDRRMRLGTYSDEGTQTCGKYPGSKGHERVDASTFAEWGVDYLKLDGCNEPHSAYPADYAVMGAALRASGRPIVFSCSWPAYLGDNETAKPYERIAAAGCNLWRNWHDVQCNWDSLSSIIDHFGNHSVRLQAVAGPGRWNDADMLLVGAVSARPAPCRARQPTLRRCSDALSVLCARGAGLPHPRGGAHTDGPLVSPRVASDHG